MHILESYYKSKNKAKFFIFILCIVINTPAIAICQICSKGSCQCIFFLKRLSAVLHGNTVTIDCESRKSKEKTKVCAQPSLNVGGSSSTSGLGAVGSNSGLQLGGLQLGGLQLGRSQGSVFTLASPSFSLPKAMGITQTSNSLSMHPTVISGSANNLIEEIHCIEKKYKMIELFKEFTASLIEDSDCIIDSGFGGFVPNITPQLVWLATDSMQDNQAVYILIKVEDSVPENFSGLIMIELTMTENGTSGYVLFDSDHGSGEPYVHIQAFNCFFDLQELIKKLNLIKDTSSLYIRRVLKE